MDHGDGVTQRLAGAGCTVCGAAVPADRIALLADRGDLAFVEVRCPVCGSQTLGLVLATATPGHAPRLADGPHHPELGPGDEARLDGAPPVDVDDVVRMRRFLDAWTGDLRSLLDEPGPGTGAG